MLVNDIGDRDGALEAPDEALNDKYLDKVSLLTVSFVHSMLQSWNFKYYQEVQRNEDLSVPSTGSILRVCWVLKSYVFDSDQHVNLEEKLTSKDEKYLQLDKNKATIWTSIKSKQCENVNVQLAEHPYAGFVHGNMYACNILGLDHNGVHTKIVALTGQSNTTTNATTLTTPSSSSSSEY
nr:4634_t:CDS:2 [Entrophospora candida]